MSTVTPDPRPDARMVADRDAWAAIITEKMGPCRVSGDLRDVDYAHLVSRAQRGDDTAANIIPLRHDLHMILHDHGAGWEEIASAIRCSLTPVEKAYISAKKGKWWLDKTYPAEANLCSRCRRPTRPAASQEPLSAPRKRRRYQFPVPDDAEDGAALLDTLIDSARADLGRPEGTPAYFTLVDCLHFFLTSSKAEAA